MLKCIVAMLACWCVSAVHRMDVPHLSVQASNSADGITETKYRQLHPKLFVVFYFPSCHACQSLQPHFDAAAEKAKSNPTLPPFVAIDCANGACDLLEDL